VLGFPQPLMSSLDCNSRRPRDAGSVLVVDDEPELRAGLRRILAPAGYEIVEASSLSGARDVLASRPIDLVLLDLGLPDGNGMSLLAALQEVWPDTTVVVLSASSEVDDMREALRQGAVGYLHKPVHPLTLEAQISGALAERRRTRAEKSAPLLEGNWAAGDIERPLEDLPFHLARQLSHAWDLRHIETGAHVRRLAESTRILALTLGASDRDATRLGRVAMLHDIGKIAIPDAILAKPGALSEDELVIMKRHAELGGSLLSGFGHPFLDLAAKVARHHHERWNGSGYPDGLVGASCPWEARLVGVVDVFDALSHVRSYKGAWPREKILDFFAAESGRSFDPEIVAALLTTIPYLEAVNSEYPDPAQLDLQSGSRLKSAAPLSPTLSVKPGR
jgi:response regulator RpfG family c-di-GMP phosphodiesterase